MSTPNETANNYQRRVGANVAMVNGEATEFPEEQIRQLQDRSYTGALLERLQDPSVGESERENLGYLLATIEDPRVIVPALALIESSNVPDDLRNIGVSLIASMGANVDVATLRRWYASDDDVLQLAAIRLVPGRFEADLLSDALQHPDARFRERAVTSLAFGFEEPTWQQRVVDRLTDVDALVRASAATTLLWNEPNGAEAPILAALHDVDESVVAESLTTLRYFPTLAVLEALFDVEHSSPSLRLVERAHDSLDHLRATLGDHLDHIGPWFVRLRMFVSKYDANQIPVIAEPPSNRVLNNGELDPEFTRAAAELHRLHGSTNEPIDSEALLDLRDPNGYWAIKHARLHRGDPHSIALSSRAEVTAELVNHPDMEVRSSSARYLAAFGDAASLLRLADDPQVAVRKSAIFYLHEVEASPEIAERAIAGVRSGELAGTQAHEAMRTWGRHRFVTAPDSYIKELLDFTFDLRESVRCEAVEQLISCNATQAGSRLLALLGEPPIMTWAVHTTILSGYSHVALTHAQVNQACTQWLDVDNLWIQVALAALGDGAA
jgi:HEAT repeat protein